MNTLSTHMMKTNMMMEQMKRQAIIDLMEKYEEALVNYYTQGYDNGETTDLYNQLVIRGVDHGVLVDTDLEIRDRVSTEEDMQVPVMVQLNGLYGDEERIAYFREQGVGCFDFTWDKKFATVMPKFKCISILAHQDYYCKQFNAKDMTIVEA